MGFVLRAPARVQPRKQGLQKWGSTQIKSSGPVLGATAGVALIEL
jgi:hypothetical protein